MSKGLLVLSYNRQAALENSLRSIPGTVRRRLQMFVYDSSGELTAFSNKKTCEDLGVLYFHNECDLGAFENRRAAVKWVLRESLVSHILVANDDDQFVGTICCWEKILSSDVDEADMLVFQYQVERGGNVKKYEAATLQLCSIDLENTQHGFNGSTFYSRNIFQVLDGFDPFGDDRLFYLMAMVISTERINFGCTLASFMVSAESLTGRGGLSEVALADKIAGLFSQSIVYSETLSNYIDAKKVLFHQQSNYFPDGRLRVYFFSLISKLLKIILRWRRLT